MNKKDLRNIYRTKRLSLSDKELLVNQDLILIQFQKLSLPPLSLVHSFLPLYDTKEPDPIPMLDWLRFVNPGMQVCFSKINESDFSMQILIQDDETLYSVNKYGIPEPIDGEKVTEQDIDMAIIPLLAFDKDGHRVGYGKGYYDRFIEKCSPDMIKVGISYFQPVDKIDDLGIFDKKLDFCITPEQIYAF
jgi:5-formyltetrahydrofolate cyclo-ligase